MRARDFLIEGQVEPEHINHAKNRAKKAGRLCRELGSGLILYRGMNTRGMGRYGMLTKMTPRETQFRTYGAQPSQNRILEHFDMKNPVFCYNQPRSSIFGPLGIVIPERPFRAIWSDVVLDMGGESAKFFQGIDLENSEQVAAKIDEAYNVSDKQLPQKHDGEVVVNCDHYYYMHAETFVKSVLGKNRAEKYSREYTDRIGLKQKHLDLTKMSEDIKTYKDLAWWFEERLYGYLEWVEKQYYSDPRDVERQRNMRKQDAENKKKAAQNQADWDARMKATKPATLHQEV